MILCHFDHFWSILAFLPFFGKLHHLTASYKAIISSREHLWRTRNIRNGQNRFKHDRNTLEGIGYYAWVPERTLTPATHNLILGDFRPFWTIFGKFENFRILNNFERKSAKVSVKLQCSVRVCKTQKISKMLRICLNTPEIF